MSHSSYMTDKLAHIIVSRLLMQKKIDAILQAIIDRGSMNPNDDKALAGREYQLSQLELEYRLLTGRSFTDISNEEIEAAEALLERCSVCGTYLPYFPTQQSELTDKFRQSIYQCELFYRPSCSLMIQARTLAIGGLRRNRDG
jgi:hypothetical protein